MTEKERLSLALLLMRVSIFIVMLVWTLDKFINPDHAAAVYEKFYLLGGLGKEIMYGTRAIELAILAGFICGAWKRVTYAMVLAFHTISTLSSYKKYLAPYDGANILFFAAWPHASRCTCCATGICCSHSRQENDTGAQAKPAAFVPAAPIHDKQPGLD